MGSVGINFPGWKLFSMSVDLLVKELEMLIFRASNLDG